MKHIFCKYKQKDKSYFIDGIIDAGFGPFEITIKGKYINLTLEDIIEFSLGHQPHSRICKNCSKPFSLGKKGKFLCSEKENPNCRRDYYKKRKRIQRSP